MAAPAAARSSITSTTIWCRSASCCISITATRICRRSLEFLERRQIRVAVIEMQHEADRHQIVVEVIEERAAAGAAIERPAERVLHQALAMLVGRDLPQLLQAEAEFL